MEALPVRPESIPEELKQCPQWVAWKLEPRPGETKPTKVPYNVRTGGKAVATAAATWVPFAAALSAFTRSGAYQGIGFVLNKSDPYCGIDLDGCRDPETGVIADWAREILLRLDSYSEVSPSGTGVKVWVRGKHPGGRHKVGGFGPDGSGVVEVYDHARFFTTTGHQLASCPGEIFERQFELDWLCGEVFPPAGTVGAGGGSGCRNPAPVALCDQELLDRATRAKNGAEFERLWRGDTSGHGGDDSRADLALCRHLAFWTGGDGPRMEQLFRRSGLMREKWERQDYREGTIAKALTGMTEFYEPGRPESRGRVREHGPGEDAGGEGKRSQATLLVDLAKGAGVELFHTADEETYATVPAAGHRETWKLGSAGFKGWLQAQFLREQSRVPGGNAVQDALNSLKGLALLEGPRLPVYTRLAAHGDAVYLNLGNDAWQVVEITAAGWRLTRDPPVKFLRPRGMLPLPLPEQGGSIDLLRPFVNVRDEDWPLAVGWLVGSLRPAGPYPIAELQGEQGSAKSTTARLLRSLVDPNHSPLRAEPKNEHDIAIAGKNGWVVVYDNLSSLYPWLSDALCRLSTGGGLGTRLLYTDDEEALFDAQRPVILNGIGGVVNRSDLLDRSLLLRLPAIPEDRRRTEQEFWAAFGSVQGRVMGALLDGVSAALRNLPEVRLDRLPRMADFARWMVAAEPGLGWESGTFLRAYGRNRQEANTIALEASALGDLLLRFMRGQSAGVWEGIAQELLQALEQMAGEAVRARKDWPKSPRSLSIALQRVLPNLRAEGVEFEELKREGSRRPFRLRVRDAKDDATALRCDANRQNTQTAPAPNDASDGNDGSSGPYSGAYIPADRREREREQGETPEFASPASLPSPRMSREGAALLELARSRGFPRVEIAPGIYVGPGEEWWEPFAAGATGERRARAEAELLKNAENPGD